MNKLKDLVQIGLTLVLAGAWIRLVFTDKASPEGLIVVAVYAVKKMLDLIEEEKKNGHSQISKG